jgi:hypothetical protein
VEARDHLADQPDREKLDADDDEEGRRERQSSRLPIAWPCALRK